MNHSEKIYQFVKLLRDSSRCHALVVKGPHGSGKSYMTEKATEREKIDYISLGSYATPLFLYNSLARNPSKCVIVDDCAGLFGNSTAMAILKAATFPSAGTNGMRIVKWGSTSTKGEIPEFEFKGKLILLANHLPSGIEMEAFLSRTFRYEFSLSRGEVMQMLKDAAACRERFPDQAMALRVVEHIFANLDEYADVSIRTLTQAYDLATAIPDSWEEMFQAIAPKATPRDIAERLEHSDLSTVEKAKKFIQITGKSERTYYNLMQRLRDAPLLGVERA